MKIVQILETFQPYDGEISSYAGEFAKTFVEGKHGGVVNLVLFAAEDDKRNGYDMDGYRVIYLPTVKIGSRRFLKIWSKEYWNCFKRIRMWNPDTIHTHSRSFLVAIIGLLCSVNWNKKWVFFEHFSGRRAKLGWWKSINRKIFNRTFGRITLSFCNNIFVMNQLSYDYLKKFTSKKINLVYRGCALPIVKKPVKTDFVIRLCFISDIIKISGIGTLFKAYVEIVKNHPNVMLDIIGDGDEKAELENLIVKFGLTDGIRVLGKLPRNEIGTKYLPTYDILIHPALDSEELISESVLWGLFAKLIVIATDIGSVKEISNMEDLILFPVNDVNALIDAIERALIKLDKSGMSYDIVKEKFSWEKAIKQYLEICYP